MENTLDGGPSVSDSNWWVVSISQQIVNEFPGMWTRSASCLKNERDQIDVWVPVEFGLIQVRRQRQRQRQRQTETET